MSFTFGGNQSEFDNEQSDQIMDEPTIEELEADLAEMLDGKLTNEEMDAMFKDVGFEMDENQNAVFASNNAEPDAESYLSDDDKPLENAEIHNSSNDKKERI